jgi:alkyldihydroxyacetonephosphate synthase
MSSPSRCRCRWSLFVEKASELIGSRFKDLSNTVVRGSYEPGNPHPLLDTWPLILLAARKGFKLPPCTGLAEVSSLEEVVEIVRLARAYGVHVVPRGGGSAVTGTILPCSCCLVLDLTGLSGVIEVREDDRLVYVWAGTRIAELERYLNSYGLTLRFEPQSAELATIGGAIATRGSGAYAPGLGNVEDAVLWVDVVLPTGELVRVGDPVNPRGGFGPDLRGLFVGSEAAYGVIVAVGLRALPLPDHVLNVAGLLPSFSRGLDLARSMIPWSSPELLRVLDEAETSIVLGEQGSLVIARFEGDDRAVVEAKASRFSGLVRRYGGRAVDGDKAFSAWLGYRRRYRESWRQVVGAGLWVDTAEVATTWSKALKLRERVVKALEALKGFTAAATHAGHFYPSGLSLYFTIVFEAEFAVYWRVWRKLAETVKSLGASITHHHGLGVLKTIFARGELELACRVARCLDPNNLMASTLARVCRRLCLS